MSRQANHSVDPRKLAIEVIQQVVKNGRSLNALLPLALPKLQPREQGLLQELTYGVIRWMVRLEAILALLLERPLKTRDMDIKLILLAGIYQLLYTRIPDHAAVSTSVELVNQSGKSWARGLVNGVLRRFIREGAQIEASVDKDICVKTAYPQWLCRRVQADWSHNAVQLLEAGNQRASMSLRVNTLKGTREDYCALLDHSNIKYSLPDWSSVAVVLDSAVETSALPGYDQGLVSVQDLAAQNAAVLLDVQPGMRVLDACAAPGGKTAHIYESCPKLKRLLALDISPGRLQTLAENLERLGIGAKSVEWKAVDVADTAVMRRYGQFDRILLDAPCSATGVIRRHPDIKLLRRDSDIEDLVRIQQKILENLWPLLAPGGMLLYSTCSILHQENKNQITQFLATHADAELDLSPGPVLNAIPVQAGWQVMTGHLGMDGFFYAPLRHKKSALDTHNQKT